MNRSLRSLAVGSLVSLTSLVGWAAEPDWISAEPAAPNPKRIVTKPLPTAEFPPQGSVRKRTANAPEPGPRNYYQELFGARRETAVPDPEQTESPTAKMLSNRSARKGTSRPLEPEASHDGENDWETLGRSRAKNAAFDQEPGASASAVRPARVEVRPKSSRIPVPPDKPRGSTLCSTLNGAEGGPPRAAPVTGPQVSSISLEWVKKSEINVGQECQLELVVKNAGASPVEQVAVDAIFQTPVRLTSVRPQPIENRDRLTWNLTTLSAGAEERIALSLIPGRRGDLGLKAQVRLTGSASAAFRVEEPLLKVALKGPAEVMLGDSAAQMIIVSNPGTGAAHDVKITAQLSQGLEHARGESVDMEIGTLAPGESRTVRLPLTGVKGGPQTVSVTASAGAELAQVATATVNVISPSLTVTAEGPALRYKGRHAKFTVKVSNDGSVANNNTRVVQTVAEGFQFVSADRGGKFDPSSRTVSWFLGRLEPSESIEVACELTAVALGDFTQSFVATSDAGARAEAAVETRVDGTPALTMEVADLDDPVEVGVETAYEIRVKNEGSKAASNVVVSCELPAGVQLVAARGPTDARAEKRTLTFRPVSQLSPGQESIFRVHVKGVQEGQHRIQARVSSDSLEEPLLKEEQTKFYSDVRR